MSLSEVLAKRAMEFRMSDEHIRALGNLKLTSVESDALTALLRYAEEESWNGGYDDAMMDTVPKKE